MVVVGIVGLAAHVSPWLGVALVLVLLLSPVFK